MTKVKSTKRALLMSGLALLVCISMLVGSTFAWFTDSVASKNNKIVAGKLDIELYKVDLKENWTLDDIANNTLFEEVEITDSTAPIFGEDILWEPGYEAVANLKIVNNGNLALKYQTVIRPTSEVGMLAEVIDVYTCDEVIVKLNGRESYESKLTKIGSLEEVMTGKTVFNGEMKTAGEVQFFSIVLKMREDAGNKYQGQTAGTFDVTVLAAQLAHENDSFGKDYDALAEYAYAASGKLEDGAAAVELEVRDTQDTKVGSAVIPANAIDPTAEKVSVEINNSTHKANITVATGMETKAYDVTVTGLNENNTVPVKVTLRIPAGLDPATVKLYHYDNLIPSTYYPTTGYVEFESATFSPFTIVYDADSEYEAPSTEGLSAPKATVTYAPEYVGEGKVQWGSYGQWAPTPGLDSALEAAFTFKCPENLDPEVRAAFEYWYCDFYVSLDRDLGANEIFLGGYYESIGAYVGFHNGDVTLKANEELPLLGSVTTNPWTYAAIESNVGTFMCGVGDVNDALDGATFTVKLRLTNPENESEFYDVNVVTYTFGGDYVIK